MRITLRGVSRGVVWRAAAGRPYKDGTCVDGVGAAFGRLPHRQRTVLFVGRDDSERHGITFQARHSEAKPKNPFFRPI